jgi:hypothetical protein
MDEGTGRADGGNPEGSGDASVPLPQGPLATVHLSEVHNTAGFSCDKSDRVNGFFGRECPKLLTANYCRVLIYENPDDFSEVWGFYTLSASQIARDSTTGSEQKRIPGGLPVPMVRVGFMGRSDRAPLGLGSALIVDAARRVARVKDIAVWGLCLDADGGPDNSKLWRWYLNQGFTAARDPKYPALMYGALKKFIPLDIAP